MGKVVIERPRKGSSQKSPKIRHFAGRIDAEGDYDGLSKLPSSPGKIYGFAPKILEKSFTDVLGPLRRYLQKNVGRPWNHVYGEASGVLGKGGWGIEHVFEDHFVWQVDRKVYVGEDGKLLSRRWGAARKVTGFYVHPKTGLLRYAAAVRPKQGPMRKDTDRIRLADGRYYVLIGGLWFVARYDEMGQIPNPSRPGLSRTRPRWPDVEEPEGVRWNCRVEKSCNKKDLREIQRILADSGKT